MKIGFLVNPIAGMGGRVGLKGTDNMLEEALKRGATPVAPLRAGRFLTKLNEYDLDIEFLTPPSIMGEEYLSRTRFRYQVVGNIELPTSRDDTIRFLKEIFNKVEVIVFVGGDGTARDVYSVVKDSKPVIGVPSGVKIFSGVFTVTPEDAALLLKSYVENDVIIDYAEVLDIDEERYREGVLDVKLYGYMKIPFKKEYIQGGKEPTPLNEVKEELNAIAKYVIEKMRENTLYITGPGRTVKTIHEMLNIEYTPLGVDIITKNSVVALDVNEKTLIETISKFPGDTVVIVSPIGGQGFIFGRGNQVISPDVIKIVGFNNIWVISPTWKLKGLECLYIDTDDIQLNRKFPNVVKVIVGYREYKVYKICKRI